MSTEFNLKSEFQPRGDQPQAIEILAENILEKKNSNFVRCDWNRENIQCGEYYTKNSKTYSRYGTQQDFSCSII